MRRRSLALTLPLLGLFLFAACDEKTQQLEPQVCTNRNTPAISVEGDDEHDHAGQGFVCEEDRGDGILIPLHDRSSAMPHTHEYLLTEEQVRDVLDGKFVRVFTPRNLGHNHTVIYNGRGEAGIR